MHRPDEFSHPVCSMLAVDTAIIFTLIRTQVLDAVSRLPSLTRLSIISRYVHPHDLALGPLARADRLTSLTLQLPSVWPLVTGGLHLLAGWLLPRNAADGLRLQAPCIFCCPRSAVSSAHQCPYFIPLSRSARPAGAATLPAGAAPSDSAAGAHLAGAGPAAPHSHSPGRSCWGASARLGGFWHRAGQLSSKQLQVLPGR